MSSLKNIILTLLVLGGAAAAGLWVVNNPSLMNPSQPIPEEDSTSSGPIIEKRVYGDTPELDDLQKRQMETDRKFEVILNDFIKDIDSKSKRYKEARSTISAMIEPTNIRAEEYLIENRNLATSLIAEMGGYMDEVIASFETTDVKINQLVQDTPEIDKKIILDKWNGVKQEQMNYYVSFFALDSEYLDQHVKIMDFLIQSQGKYQIDVTNNRIVFADIRLERMFAEKIAVIDEIVDGQKELLRKEIDIEKR